MDSDTAFALASVLAVMFFLVLIVVSIMVPFMVRSIQRTQGEILTELQRLNDAIRELGTGSSRSN